MMKKLHQILVLSLVYCGTVAAQSAPPVAVLSDMPTQESMNAFKAKNIEIKEKNDKICADERYKPFYAKSPCYIPEITLQYLTDTSKATPAEKKVIVLIDNEYLAITQMSAENFRQNIKPEALGNALYRFRMGVNAQFQENLTNLYQGKITWGEFNTQRKALGDRARADFDRINKDPNLQK
jgi:hypothetical protein